MRHEIECMLQFAELENYKAEKGIKLRMIQVASTSKLEMWNRRVEMLKKLGKPTFSHNDILILN